MAAKGGRQWRDPYETSNRRQFVYRPNSAAEILLCPTSTSLIDSYSKSRPFGSTVYHKDFTWKPACKPECIRTGTASGQRRNNPHPSQSFMLWRVPRDAARSSEYVSFPWKCSPSEGEIRKALTAQYRSTYRCDFMGVPQGETRYDHNNIPDRRLSPLPSRCEGPLSSDKETRDHFCKPTPELLDNHPLHGRNTDPKVRAVQKHVRTQHEIPDLTNYDRFCGNRVTDVRRVVKSLLPKDPQQLHRILPQQEKEAVKTLSSKDLYPNDWDKVNKLPAVVQSSCSPEYISSWPGPT